MTGPREIRVFIEAERGSSERGLYGKDCRLRGRRKLLSPYPCAYGFVLGTTAEDGDGVDCYVVADSALREGETASCVPIGLIEQFEGEEVDHKVVARLSGEAAEPGRDFAGEIERFIHAIFKAYPEVAVSLSGLLPAERAIEHLESRRDP